MLANYSGTPVFVPKGTAIAHIVVPDDVDEAEVMNKDNTSAYTNKLPLNRIQLEPAQHKKYEQLQQEEEEEVWRCAEIDPKRSRVEKRNIRRLLRRFKDTFARNPKKPGCVSSVEHNIKTGDVKPIKKWPRRHSPQEQQIEEENVQEMLLNGIIRHSESPWAFPTVLVEKPDGSMRFCVDYRDLNALTEKDAYPLPKIDEMLDKLGKAKFFTTLDLASGYWQIPIAEKDKKKTAFVTRDGHFEFNFMPFGLCNAPATFQRLMEDVLKKLGRKFSMVYIDDIIIFSETWEQHLEHIKLVLDCLLEAGLKLKAQKCHFGFEELKFLGHIVSAKGIQTDPEKIRAIQELPIPGDVHALRRFLGMAGYYRRYIDGFSRISKPLNALTENRQGKQMVFSEECLNSFSTLKERLMTAPVLGYPDLDKDFVIHCDASKDAIGAVLAQEDKHGDLHPICYMSKVTSGAEKNWSIYDLECYAIIQALKKFRHYIHGKRTSIYTDQKALKWLLEMKEPSPRLTRWITKIQGLDLDIHYRPGRSNADADCLSRLVTPQDLEFAEGTPIESGLVRFVTVNASPKTKETLQLNAIRTKTVRGKPTQFTVVDGQAKACPETDPTTINGRKEAGLIGQIQSKRTRFIPLCRFVASGTTEGS